MILGLRCSPKDYAFAVVDGKRANPKVVKRGLVAFPKGFSRVQCVAWFVQELDELLGQHNCSQIILKAFEGMHRSKPFVERIEHESAAYVSATKKGIKQVTRKVNRTIAKDLGLKGKAKYLSILDTSLIPDFDSADAKVQEAILVGWSGLH